MRLAIQPDTLTERVGLALNLVPVPLVETQIALVSARAIAAAAELGVFSALVKEPLTAAEIASDCQLSPRAVEALAGALTATDYLRYRNGRYQLSPKSRKWLAAQGAWSLFDYMPHLRDVWEIVAHMEDFLRTGEALEIHSGGLTAEQWSRYQNAMRALAAISATEAAARLPVRTGSTRMLDIGGSHGYYSVALCRRYPGLTATILDLPEAVEQAAPILAQEKMGDRVQHQAGDALKDDLGENRYELILLSNLVHHFSDRQNRDLAVRAARALTPGGSLVIQEMIRPSTPDSGDQAGQVLNLFFALTSTSGTWSIEEMQSWMREAKLTPQRPVFLRSVPGAAQLRGVKFP